jgi:hypothetical protein
MKYYLALLLLLTFYTSLSANPCGLKLIVNEFSRGPSLGQAFIEFLVVGTPGTTQDIRGLIFDDNSGRGISCGAGNINPGHYRFSSSTVWQNVPVGSLIVVYNVEQKNPKIPADDPFDSNNDGVYVVPSDNATLLEVVPNFPSSFFCNQFSGSAQQPALNSWSAVLNFDNFQDLVQIVNPALPAEIHHGIAYGFDPVLPNLIPFLATGNFSPTFQFTLNNNSSPLESENFAVQSASVFDSPGLPNSASNQEFIQFLRTRQRIQSTSRNLCTGWGRAILSVENPLSFATYQWSPPGLGNQTSGSRIEVNAAGVGSSRTYSLTGFYKPSSAPTACNFSFTEQITLTTSATGDILPPTVSNTSPVCEGETVVLIAQDYPANQSTYRWNGPGGYSSSSDLPVIPNARVNESGRYTLVFRIASCAPAVATTDVVINPQPTVAITSNSPICSGKVLELNGIPFTNGEYRWQGPNGFSATGQKVLIPNVTTANAGNYSLTLTVPGCSPVVTTRSISVGLPLRPGITLGTNAPVCAGESINLTADLGPNNAALTGVRYLWTGPSGFVSTFQNPVFVNVSTENSGTYRVQVQSPGCEAFIDSVVAIVNEPPRPPLLVSNSPLCSGEALRLTAISDPDAEYFWSGPADFSATGPFPVRLNVLPEHSGTYKVTVTQPGCPPEQAYIGVFVQPGPTASSNSPLCKGQQLNLQAPFFPNAQYRWSGPSGFTSTLQNPFIPNVTSANSGIYTVSIILENPNNNEPCPIRNLTTEVRVNEVSGDIRASYNGPLCEGNTLNLNAFVPPGTFYYWLGPNGFTSNEPTPQIRDVRPNLHAGRYTIIIPGCNAAAFVDVEINQRPTNVSPTSNSPLCAGQTLSLNVHFYVNASYSWLGPANFSSTLQNPSRPNVSPGFAGIYTVTVQVPGCSPVVATTPVVEIGPGAVARSNSPVCADGELRLDAEFVPGARYRWSGPLGFSSTLRSPVLEPVSIQNRGVYTLTVTLPFGPCSVSVASTEVIVNEPPAGPAPRSNSPVCVGQTLRLSAAYVPGVAYFEWRGPNGFTSTENDPIIENVTLEQAGRYELTIPGCRMSAFTTVQIRPAPIFTLSSNSPVCQGQNLSLTANPLSDNTTISWSGPGLSKDTASFTIPNATPANAGTYTAIANRNGCLLARSINVEVLPLPSVNFTNNSPLCQGNTLRLTTTSVPGALYLWRGPNNFSVTTAEPGGSFPNIGLNASGVYTLTVVLNGCSALQTSLVTVNPRVPQGATANSPLCLGGELRFSAPTLAGGSYAWAGPLGFASTLQNPTLSEVNLAQAGTYTLTLNYPDCPVVTQTVNVEINEAPAPIELSANAPICQNGVLELSANNQPKNASFSWSGPNRFISSLQNPRRQNLTLLDAGNYTLTVQTPGCPLRQAVLPITVNPAPNTPIATLSTPVCEGQNLSLTVSNPQTNLQYLWRGPNNFSSTAPNTQIPAVTAAAQGVYSVTASLNGCPSLPLVLLAEVIPTVVFSANITPTSRPGRNDGAISLSLQQSIAPVLYNWSGPAGFTATTASIANLRVGVYTLNITNGNGCQKVQTFTVGTNPPLSVTVLRQSPTCFGGRNGSLVAQVTGGVPPYQYEWSGPSGFSASTPLASNLTAGNYQLLVSDFVGNLELVDISLSQPNPLTLVPEITPISCFGANDGRVILSATGGTSPYVFSWQDGIETPIRNTIAPGSYIVTTRDINGCSRRDTLAIIEPPLLSSTFTLTQPLTCLPGATATLCINISGGTAPYQFYYSESQETTLVTQAGVCALQQNLQAGAYQYNIRDSRGCVATRGVNIVPPTPPSIQLVFQRDAGCLNDGSLLVRAVGGREPYQYVWDNGALSNTLNNLAPGVYRLLIIDAFACQAETSFTVGTRPEQETPIITARSVSVTCAQARDGQIIASAVLENKPLALIEFSLDGQNYRASGNFAGLAPGNYTVYAREVGSRCAAMRSITVPSYVPASQPIASGVTTSQAFVSWQTASSPTTRYRLEYRVLGAEQWEGVGVITGADTLLQNLQNNTTYQVRVVSLCGAGVELPSEITTFRTALSPASCRTPGSVYVNSLNPTTALLNWEALPGFTGCYVIEYRSSQETNWRVEIATNAFSRYELRGLEPGAQYEVRLRANCSNCTPSAGLLSEYSPIVTFRMPVLRESEIVKSAPSFYATVYPNPTSGQFQVQVTAEALSSQTLHFEVLDLQGRLLQTFSTTIEGLSLQDFSLPFSSGIYFLNIRIGNQKQTIKLFKL